MGVQIYLNFENESCIFRPGQVITGAITLNTGSKQVVKGLTLTFVGEGLVQWMETERRGESSANAVYPQLAVKPPPPHFASSSHFQNMDYVVREYGNTETYFHHSMTLPITQEGVEDDPHSSPGDEVELPEGCYKLIPFSFQLPMNIPSSCNLTYGSVKYYAEATLNTKNSLMMFSSDSNKTSRRDFFISGFLDLTMVNDALKPFHLRIRDEFESGFCCCSSVDGDLILDLFLARFGFVPGEPIIFQLDYTNTSSNTIKNMKAYLMQTITYITFGKEKSEINKLGTTSYNNLILPETSGTWTGELRLPQLAYLTDLGGSRIMRVRYKMVLSAKASMFRKTSMETPITVGNIAS